jgi:predicted DNA-binding transcriptional regulator YafY
MVRIRYHSHSSGRARDYDLAPQRVVSADGGVYLRAHVPEYGELRTFAVERIQQLTLRDERCHDWTGADVFDHSLGAFSGKPERVRLAVEQGLAAYVTEREWHPSQRLHHTQGGDVIVDLHVSVDLALRRWILSLGSQARVLAPAGLAEEIRAEQRAAADGHVRLPERTSAGLSLVPQQMHLPFGELRVLTLVGERVA